MCVMYSCKPTLHYTIYTGTNPLCMEICDLNLLCVGVHTLLLPIPTAQITSTHTHTPVFCYLKVTERLHLALLNLAVRVF